MRHRVWRRRRHGRHGADPGGRQRRHARSGPRCGTRRPIRRCSSGRTDSPRRGAAIPERQFGEFDGALGGWTIDGEPYTHGARQQFDWFRVAHARRPHEPLGPHLAAVRSARLPAQDARRPRRRLADHLRRHRSRTTTRSTGSSASSAQPPRMPNEPDGIFLPPPQAALLRAADQAGVRTAEHPVCAVATLDPDASRSTAVRRVTIAASADADARRTRTSRRRRC